MSTVPAQDFYTRRSSQDRVIIGADLREHDILNIQAIKSPVSINRGAGITKPGSLITSEQITIIRMHSIQPIETCGIFRNVYHYQPRGTGDVKLSIPGLHLGWGA